MTTQGLMRSGGREGPAQDSQWPQALGSRRHVTASTQEVPCHLKWAFPKKDLNMTMGTGTGAVPTEQDWRGRWAVGGVQELGRRAGPLGPAAVTTSRSLRSTGLHLH